MQCVFAAAEGKPEKEGKEKVGMFPGHPVSAEESNKAWLLCCKDQAGVSFAQLMSDGCQLLCEIESWTQVPAHTLQCSVREEQHLCWPIPAKSSSKNVENYLKWESHAL